MVISLCKYYDDVIYILITGEMYFLVLFVLLSGLTQTLIVYKNVTFHKTNEVALTNVLSKLSDDLRKGGIATHTVDQLYESTSKQDFKSLISLIFHLQL